jgi:hypothetical protein
MIIYDLGDKQTGPATEILVDELSGAEMIERGRGRYAKELPKDVKLGPHSGIDNRIIL